jgi:beta-lactam-binding protein with PASTA domain
MTRLFFNSVCVLVCAAAFAVPAFAGEKSVPDVCGLQVTEAKGLLEQAGFSVRVEDVQGRKIGYVISQTPSGFSKADTSNPITLRVGAPTPKPGMDAPPTGPSVPPSDDLPPAGAGDAPIQPGADEPRPAPTGPAPTGPAPTGPMPSAGALVWNGRPIPPGSLPNTAGPELPSVLGQSAERARATLRQWNVQVEQTLSVPQLVGTIVNQWPPAGSSLAAGETITIVTAVAERPSNQHRYVPQVEGRNWAEAMRSIEQDGFIPQAVSVVSSAAGRGRVLAQSPQPGSLTLGGQAVRIYVGRGPGAYSADVDAPGVDAPKPVRPTPVKPPVRPDEDLPPAGSGDMPIEPGADAPRPVQPAPVRPAPVEPAPVEPAPAETVVALGAPSLAEPPAGESYPFKYGADFKWTSVRGAASYEFELQEELPSGAWQTASTTTVSGPNYRPAKIERGRYRWRVRGVTEGGEKGRWSEYRRLYMY